jgi:hypothetical protein
MNSIVGSILLANMVLAAVFIAESPASAEIWLENAEQQKVHAEFNKSVDKLVLAKDIDGLTRLAKDTEARWLKDNPSFCAALILDCCNAIISHDFFQEGTDFLATRNRCRGISGDVARRILKQTDKLPLYLECEMALFLFINYNAEGKKLDEKSWATLRQEDSKMYLRAYSRMQGLYDKDWDPKKAGWRVVVPPEGSGIPIGGNPDDIKDPKLKAQYLAMLEARQRKAEADYDQSEVRRLMDRWLPRAEARLVGAYAKKPLADEELRKLLEEYLTDVKATDRIMDAVQKKRQENKAAGKEVP